MEWLREVPGWLEAAAALVLAWLVVWGAWKGVYLPLKKHFERVNRGMDTLLGYPPVLDPGSGRVIQDATPPLAQRVWDLEQTYLKLANALELLAANQQTLLRLEAEMDERRRVGDEIIADFTAWRREVNAALKKWISEQDELGQIVRENAHDPQEQERNEP